MSPEPELQKQTPVLPIVLGFIPLLLSLALYVFHRVFRDPLEWMGLAAEYLAACVISIVCGGLASWLLFRSKAGPAIAYGITFLLVNTLISIFLLFLWGLSVLAESHT